jgi:F-type H+-transporting ATPase subunit b
MIAVVTQAGGIRLLAQTSTTEEHDEDTTATTDEVVDQHNEGGETVAEHEGAEAGGEHEGVEAPNPILPATNELIWGGLSFAILFVAMVKWGFPAVNKAMAARADRIREDLDTAAAAKTEAETMLGDYQRQLADAKNEANRIIEEARQTADQLRKDLMARAEAEVNELRQRNREEIEAAKARTLAELRSDVTTLALDLADKVVAANLDRTTNTALVERFIAEVEGQRA